MKRDPTNYDDKEWLEETDDANTLALRKCVMLWLDLVSPFSFLHVDLGGSTRSIFSELRRAASTKKARRFEPYFYPLRRSNLHHLFHFVGYYSAGCHGRLF